MAEQKQPSDVAATIRSDRERPTLSAEEAAAAQEDLQQFLSQYGVPLTADTLSQLPSAPAPTAPAPSMPDIGGDSSDVINAWLRQRGAGGKTTMPDIGADSTAALGDISKMPRQKFVLVDGKYVVLPQKEEPPIPMAQQPFEVLRGMGQGAASTAWGLGSLAYKLGAKGLAVDFPSLAEGERPAWMTPQNLQQTMGKGLEQTGEFMVPAGVFAEGAKAAKTLEMGKAGLLTLAQGGGPYATAAAMGLAAFGPGAVGRTASELAEDVAASRAKTIVRALAPKGAQAQADAREVAAAWQGPGGKSATMLDHADKMAGIFGPQVERTYAAAGAAGETIDADILQGNIELARDKLMTPVPGGTRTVKPGNEAAVKHLDELAALVAKKGGANHRIPVDQDLLDLKRDWDAAVQASKGFNEGVQLNPKTEPEAYGYQQAGTALRDQIQNDPNLADITNSEKQYRYWALTRKLLRDREAREAAKEPGLWKWMKGESAIVGGGGGLTALGDVAFGRQPGWDVVGGAAGAIASERLAAIMTTPQFRTMLTAPTKDLVARALAGPVTGPLVITAYRAAMESLPIQAQHYLIHLRGSAFGAEGQKPETTGEKP